MKLRNFGKIKVSEGETNRIYVNTDNYFGERIVFSHKYMDGRRGDFSTIGYIDIEMESWLSDWYQSGSPRVGGGHPKKACNH
uniref:Uncharacterized protein n=1 Tax=Firmicutes phage HS16 TaxID=3056394 RepID=A0AA50AF35_9VIRU|nr:MAG: hypothetical protein [Firmicutes phage HS16]